MSRRCRRTRADEGPFLNFFDGKVRLSTLLGCTLLLWFVRAVTCNFRNPGDDWLGHYTIAARTAESIAWLYVLNVGLQVESDCLAVFHGRDLQADSGQDDQSVYSGPLQFLGTGLGCTAQQQGVSSWHQQSALLCISSAGRGCVLISTHVIHTS